MTSVLGPILLVYFVFPAIIMIVTGSGSSELMTASFCYLQLYLALFVLQCFFATLLIRERCKTLNECLRFIKSDLSEKITISFFLIFQAVLRTKEFFYRKLQLKVSTQNYPSQFITICVIKFNSSTRLLRLL